MFALPTQLSTHFHLTAALVKFWHPRFSTFPFNNFLGQSKMTFYTPEPSFSGSLMSGQARKSISLPRNNFYAGQGVGNIPSGASPTTGIDPFESMLHGHEAKFCTYSNANIYATTFNVNGKSPPESLCEWLNFDTTSLPDFIAIGLQEMDLALNTYVIDTSLRQDEWMFVLSRNLPNIYKQVAYIRLIGIFLVLYQREDSKIAVSNVHLSSIATGFLRMGNKGGVGISIRLNDTNVCFINSHLAAGNAELPKRNQDYREISQMRFDNGLGIYDHETVLWLGDLNYRLNNLTYEEVVRECYSTRYEELFKHDQLKEQQRLRTAFNGFQEKVPRFRPTYKFDVGTSTWDTSEKRRIPAWCDRILYWTRDKSIKIEQLSYTSVEKVVFSDHKPVCATFNLAVKLIDQKKRNAVYEEVLRESDKKANDKLPVCTLSQTEFKFGEVYFEQPAVGILTIKNTGLTATHFSFAATHQAEDMPENWLTVTPKSSFLEVGAEVEVTIQVVVDDEKVRPNIELSCILVIRLDQGRDYFVVVNAQYNGIQKETESEKIVNDASKNDWLIDLSDS
uniref:Inositol polyphosphate-related phosphatase domain-containing protein n=1 Tax=Ditylenchus dipsaci TaxID=166011 RepID=A0A915DMG6_9BILA